MKKITWDEWKEQELAKRKEYKEMGVIDFETIRAEKMWADPTVKDDDIPSVRVVFDKELGTLVLAEH